jgi:hypothetical protein
MWEFRVIELLTYCSLHPIDINMHCLENVKLKESLHCRPSVALSLSK